MGFLARYTTGALVFIVAVVILHELSHAALDRSNGYNGPYKISFGKSAWKEGWVGRYQRGEPGHDGLPDVESHHDILHPAGYALAAIAGIGIAIWAARASPIPARSNRAVRS